jgi:hypothetical protein
MTTNANEIFKSKLAMNETLIKAMDSIRLKNKRINLCTPENGSVQVPAKAA